MADESRRPTLSDVRRKSEETLLSLPGVVGVSEGRRDEQEVIQILVARGIDVDIPPELDGYPVEVIETGAIQAE